MSSRSEEFNPIPPTLIEPNQETELRDLNYNAPEMHNPVFEVNRDIMKLRMEDCDSNPTSSCGEDDDENPEESFDAVLSSDSSWLEPANDVVVQMVALLDHYFSDENLVKDKFLLKHVRRNKQGYVSVKLLTSFKKLKHLSRSDWRVTAFCCKSSSQLELNHSGTKVKRKDQLPHIDLPTTSIKTVLAKVPNDEVNMTVDEISQIFRQYGSLSTVRLIRPGKEIPLDLRNHIAKHPEIGSLTCAVVEFDKTEECQNAYKNLGKKARDENTGWEYSLLGSGRNPRRQQKKMKAKERQLLGGTYGYDSSEEFNSSPYVSSRENSPEIRRRNFPVNQNRQFLTPSPLVSPYGSRSNSPARSGQSLGNSPSFQRRSAGDASSGCNKWGMSPRGGKPVLGQSPLAMRKQITSPVPNKATPPSPLAVPNNQNPKSTPMNNNTDDPISSPGSPWVRRRRDYLARLNSPNTSQGNTPIGSPSGSPIMGRKNMSQMMGDQLATSPPAVVRMPHGPPDNATKGFNRETQETRVLGKLEMLSSQVAAAACDNPQH